MKILHIAAGLQETCGVSNFVVEIAKAQKALGMEVSITTAMTCGYPMGDLAFELLDDPTKTAFQPDIVHIHSVWNMYIHKMVRWCRKHNIPYIISPHGALTPWALKYRWWKKIPALILYQYVDFIRANGFHVTVKDEAMDVRRLRLKQPITIAPLGVDLPKDNLAARNNDLLFLSRIHPIKGLIMLLNAWHNVPKSLRQNWRLIIAGSNDVNHQEELIIQAHKLGLGVTDYSVTLEHGKKTVFGGEEVPLEVYKQKLSICNSEIIFTGPVYNQTKGYLYQSAKYFVLPSYSENFGAVVLESLAAGTPVITTTGTPWQELEANHCGWWIPPNEEELTETLIKALSQSPLEYEQYSNNGRKLVCERYIWKQIAKTLIDSYRNILKK